jgi:hypothetical protein
MCFHNDGFIYAAMENMRNHQKMFNISASKILIKCQTSFQNTNMLENNVIRGGIDAHCPFPAGIKQLADQLAFQSANA